MNKIIPVLCFILSLVGATAAALGIVTVSVATAVPEIGVVAVPTAIIGTVISALIAALTFMFRRDKLCRISLFVSVGALAVSVVSLIIWFCLL